MIAPPPAWPSTFALEAVGACNKDQSRELIVLAAPLVEAVESAQPEEQVRGRLSLAVLAVSLSSASAFGQSEAVPLAAPTVERGAMAVSPAPAPPMSQFRRDFERTNFGWLGLLGLPGLAPLVMHDASPVKPKRR